MGAWRYPGAAYGDIRTQEEAADIMGTAIFVLLVVGALAGGFFFLRRGRDAHGAARTVDPIAAPAAPGETPRRQGRMANPCEDRCSAIQKIEGRWFPEGEVPTLPLSNCDRTLQCRCTWLRVVDRRMTHRRGDRDRRGAIRVDDREDRRKGVDRRAEARNPWKNIS
ncbi:MAG: hypothetical protein K0Q76_2380 [Panacagrimonas sp.]|nr:hypothetical protein [Panacagrimonas sp.]